MRIISKERDYYDGVQGMAFDKSLLYVRTPIEVPKENVKNYKLPKIYLSDMSYRLDRGVIGFCGKLYPFISDGSQYVKGGFHCYYSLAELERKLNINKYQHKRLEEFFKVSEDLELFIQNKSPIFVYDGKKIIWNSLLRTYSFEKVVDPYQAFQSIRMFLSNLASPEVEIPKVDDKSNLLRHGFDNWSFKKRGKSQ